MLVETVFRSDDLPAADRFDSWRELMGRTHAPMDLRSDYAADYYAQLRRAELGAVTVWPATFQPLTFLRTPKLIRQSDPENYHVSLLVKGEGGATWGRHEASYAPYDLHTTESSRPYEVWTGREPVTTVGVEVPKALLPLPRHLADRAIGRPMSGREGIGALLAQFLSRLAADIDTYRPSDGPRLGVVLADLIAALFAQTVEASDALTPDTRETTLLLRIRSFIQQHLHDPELTPSAVAAAHHISTSYLHRIFQCQGSTVAAWIRAQRLQQARRDLCDPALAATPIHAIAARSGYPRAADFSRAFRTAYGLSPRDCRAQALRSSEWTRC